MIARGKMSISNQILLTRATRNIWMPLRRTCMLMWGEGKFQDCANQEQFRTHALTVFRSVLNCFSPYPLDTLGVNT